MLYERSLEIETRLDAVLRLIRTGRYSTPKLAQQLRVSVPTVSRCVNALRAGDTTSKPRGRPGSGGICSSGRPPTTGSGDRLHLLKL